MMRILRGSGALLALIATIVVLHLMARFDLRGPSGLSGRELSLWFEDPTAVIATFLRWLALFLAYYLAAVVAALTVFGQRVQDSALGALVPSWMASTAGVLLGVTAVSVPLAAHMASSDTPQDIQATAAPLALHQLDDPLTFDAIPSGDGHPGVVSDVQAAEVRGVTATSVDRDSVWEVRSGDSFWSIAEETILDQRQVAATSADAATVSGEEVSDEEVANYWRILIAANEDRLIEPGNPDLILPGQELVLPPVT